jgi:hypothetical protein
MEITTVIMGGAVLVVVVAAFVVCAVGLVLVTAIPVAVIGITAGLLRRKRRQPGPGRGQGSLAGGPRVHRRGTQGGQQQPPHPVPQAAMPFVGFEWAAMLHHHTTGAREGGQRWQH